MDLLEPGGTVHVQHGAAPSLISQSPPLLPTPCRVDLIHLALVSLIQYSTSKATAHGLELKFALTLVI